MDHLTSKEYISHLLDNELAGEHLQPLFEHLAECEECCTFFQRIQAMQKAMQRMSRSEPSSAVDRKFDALRMSEQRQPVTIRKLTISVPTAMLSAIMIFMVSLMVVFFIRNLSSYISDGEQKPEAVYMNSPAMQLPRYN